MVRAEYATRNGRGQAMTYDVSSGGLFIQTRNPLSQGERIQLSLDWPALLDGQHALRLDIKGRVLRTNGRGGAVRILSYDYRLAPKDVARLRRAG
jgi:Tfp pilus assembly protein PilZ